MWLETVSLISLRVFLFCLILICSFSSNQLFYEMTFISVEIDFGAKFQLFCDWQLNTVFILLLEELLTNVNLKTLLHEDLLEPAFRGNLVYKFRGFVGYDFSGWFKFSLTGYKKIDYNMNVQR